MLKSAFFIQLFGRRLLFDIKISVRPRAHRSKKKWHQPESNSYRQTYFSFSRGKCQMSRLWISLQINKHRVSRKAKELAREVSQRKVLTEKKNRFYRFRPLAEFLIPIQVFFGEIFKKAVISAWFSGKGNRAFNVLHFEYASDWDLSPSFTTQYLPL